MRCYLLFLFGFIYASTQLVAQTPLDFCVQIEASVATNPQGQPRIRLSWQPVPNASFYFVYRKALADAAFPATPVHTGTNPALTTFLDNSASVPAGYEYLIQASNSSNELIAVGNIYAGLHPPVKHHSGYVRLGIAENLASTLEVAFAQLAEDLRADGFTVSLQTADPTATPVSVRAALRDWYATLPQAAESYVYLLGQVPVPYSGNISPDGHEPDHKGAWPADVFYADLAGADGWTDVTVDNTEADRPQNQNVPGDGKYDQDVIPGSLEARVGRVSLHNLPAFGEDELTLMQRYLSKNRAFRYRERIPEDRALIKDNFQACCQQYMSPFSATAWRNYTAFFGADNVAEFSTQNALFDTLEHNSYRAVFGAGNGLFDSVDGIGNADSFALYQPQAVFWALMGSYFGDWDTPNNIMRAALASNGWGLASFWAGRPYWPLQHMALGEPIGLSTLLAQQSPQNLYGYDFGHRMVHIALMGDPTLRLAYPATVQNLLFTPNAEGGTLQWDPPMDGNPIGYYVYGKTPDAEGYDLLTAEPTLQTTIATNLCAQDESGYRFLVRAAHEVQNASGVYYQLSPGISVTGDCAANDRLQPLANALRVYYQPLGKKVQMQAEAPVSGHFTLSDALGRIHVRQMIHAQSTRSWDVGHLATGVYVCTIVATDGRSFQQKLVITN